MSYLTKYGTYFGLVPNQVGRVHFVAPSDSYTVDGRTFAASNDNDGLSPERALRTIAQAYTNVTASAGEVILLLPGTHAPAATVRIQKAGITIAGVRSPFASDLITSAAFGAVGLPSKVSFATAAAPGFSIEADQVEIAFLEIRPASGFSAVYFRNADPDALFIHDCMFNLAAGQAISLDTVGIDFGYRADTAGLASRSMARLRQTTQRATAYVANVSFVSGGANGWGVLTATADASFVGCRFHTRAGAWASPFVIATGTGYVFIQGSHWTAQTVNGIGVAVDGTTAGIINGKASVRDCRFQTQPLNTGVAVDNFTAGVVEVVESYQAQVGGVAGTAQSSSA